MYFKAKSAILSLGLLLLTNFITYAQLPIGSNLPGVRFDWHPEGTMMAIAENSTVRILDQTTNQVIRVLPPFTNFVTDVKWNPDGTKLAIANGHEVQIWQAPWNSNNTQAELVLQLPQSGTDYGIVSIDWHPSQAKILGVNTPKVYVWDTTTGQIIQTITSHQSAILSAIWSTDGQKIIRGDVVGGVVAENLSDGSAEYSEFFDREGVYSLAWSPSEDRVIAGNGSGIIQTFVFSPFFSGSGYIETHTKRIMTLSWNPMHSNLIASGSIDGEVMIWDINTQEAVAEAQVTGVVPFVAWSPDGSKLAYGDTGGAVQIVPAPNAAFPATSVLDNFNRADGELGGNWGGGTSGYYQITNQQLDVLNSEAIYWSAASFGANQEAFVTLTAIDPNADEIDLLLKQQGTSWQDGVLEIWYQPTNQRVQVWTHDPTTSWVQHGGDIPVTFAAGDQFGARAKADGTVEVYKNGTLLASRDVSGWAYYADGGAIGMWMINAGDTLLDDFGGGDVP